MLTYDEYYNQQMKFFDRYIRKQITPADNIRLDRINKKKPQQSIYFLDDFLGIDQVQALKTTQIGYDPLTCKDILAPSASEAKTNRAFTRNRIIYGPVDFYLDKQLENPTEISVITACAPNLMGTSDADLQQFSTKTTNKKGSRQLKVNEYAQEADKLAEFIVATAKNAGNDRLIMPAFGVGVYIKTLNKKSQALATQIMYEAFAKAAAKNKIQVEWMVWANETKYEPKVMAETLSSYSQNNPYMKPVIEADMLDYTKQAIQNGQKVAMLNPGSDRTIGGKFTHKNPKTLEEQIAQQSDLLVLHSQFNEAMVKNFNDEFKFRKNALLNQGQVKPNPLTPTKPPVPNLKSIAELIGKIPDINEVPWVIPDSKNSKISFKSQTIALKFCNYLYQNDIVSHKNNSLPKTIQPEGKYFVVFLTNKDYSKLVNLLTKYTAKELHYEHARFDNSSRFHAFTADSKSQSVKPELKHLKGDALKTQILSDFKSH